MDMKSVLDLAVICLFGIILSALSGIDVHAACTPAGSEIADNSVDEDCDGWIGTTYGYQLRSEHPRSLITKDEMDAALARAYGPDSREPYSTWFDRIAAQEIRCHANPSSTCPESLIDLAILYKASGNASYRDWYLDLLEDSLYSREPGDYSGGNIEEALSMDIMWDDIPDDLKLRAYALNSALNAYYYHSGANYDEQNFAYHGAYGRAQQLIFSASIAFDPILSSAEVRNNPSLYSLDTPLFIKTLKEEMYPGGTFYQVERRIAGDPANNPVIQGDYGGIYDNFGYDWGEESSSIYLISAYQTATGEQIMDYFLHDKYRGRLYQMMGNPSMTGYFGTGENSYKTSEMARIWFTQTGSSTPRREAVALTALKYQDPYMQYWADLWRKAYNTYSYTYFVDQTWWFLFFYDGSLSITAPESNPTSMYFNGPGLVSMRSGWEDDATFAVFVCGEGISRRYEDANSFIIYRDGPIFLHAGARIRFNDDNHRITWYHQRSISKNTLKIFDPEERFDVDRNGNILPLHTGTYALVASDNMGGMVSETGISTTDKEYGETLASRGCNNQLYGECEAGNMLKYEYEPGEYTYSVGDASVAYTEKIDYYTREFLYLPPDTFVVFDKVRSVDPDFKKVWVAHTIFEPVVTGTPAETGNGMKTYEDADITAIDNLRSNAFVHSLLPKENRIVVRGGDTILVNRPLRPGTPIAGSQVKESDIYRWLELFAVGPDVSGSVTITGDAQEGVGVSETVAFEGVYQEYASSRPTSVSDGVLEDTTQAWKDDQWVGYYLKLRGGDNSDHLITGNSRDTIYVSGGFSPSYVWGYEIRRPLANSQYHWKRITSITTTDMDIDNFTVSTPHYFDAEDASGRLETFAPKTDGADDTEKRLDIGQWTLNIEARVPMEHDNFLNVFYLTDSGNSDTDVELIEGTDSSGAMIGGSKVVLFNNQDEDHSGTQFTVDSSGDIEFLLFDMMPNRAYNIYDDGILVQTGASSDMGVLSFGLELASSSTITVSDGGLLSCSSIGGVCKDSACSSQGCTAAYGECSSGYCCRCSVHEADTNNDGTISVLELSVYIGRWKNGSVSIADLIDAIKLWKS